MTWSSSRGSTTWSCTPATSKARRFPPACIRIFQIGRGELLVRRRLVEDSLLLMQRVHLVDVVDGEDGNLLHRKRRRAEFSRFAEGALHGRTEETGGPGWPTSSRRCRKRRSVNLSTKRSDAGRPNFRSHMLQRDERARALLRPSTSRLYRPRSCAGGAAVRRRGERRIRRPRIPASPSL